MKPVRPILLLLLVFLQLGNASAQYRKEREQYPPSTYQRMPGDHYRPFWKGVASAFIPGLGQVTMGETRRGFVFLGLAAVAFTGANLASNEYELDPSSELEAAAILSTVVYYGITLVSVVDAAQMAKVKNAAYRTTRGRTYHPPHLELTPVLMNAPSFGTAKYSPGLGLRLRF